MSWHFSFFRYFDIFQNIKYENIFSNADFRCSCGSDTRPAHSIQSYTRSSTVSSRTRFCGCCAVIVARTTPLSVSVAFSSWPARTRTSSTVALCSPGDHVCDASLPHVVVQLPVGRKKCPLFNSQPHCFTFVILNVGIGDKTVKPVNRVFSVRRSYCIIILTGFLMKFYCIESEWSGILFTVHT